MASSAAVDPFVPTIEETAYHEAGHAVACWLLRQDFERVTIVSGDDFAGRVDGRDTARIARAVTVLPLLADAWDFPAEALQAVAHTIMVVVAGQLAEDIWRSVGRRRPFPPPPEPGYIDVSRDAEEWDESRDGEQVRQAAWALTKGDEVEAQAFVDWLTVRTHRMLLAHWRTIGQVARALQRRGSLNASQVLDICLRAQLANAGRAKRSKIALLDQASDNTEAEQAFEKLLGRAREPGVDAR